MNEHSRSADEIEREIRDTRAEIGETIDALQRKLSPGEIVDQAMRYVRDDGGQFVNNIGRTLRDNPMPVLLTGVGLVWLMTVSRRPSSAYALGDESGPAVSDETVGVGATYAPSVGEGISGQSHQSDWSSAAGSANYWGQSGASRAGSAGRAAADRLESARRSARERFHDAVDRAGELRE